MHILSVPTRTHGRVILDGPLDLTGRLLVIFHGYGMSAEAALADARKIPGLDGWRIAAVQGLHRFYAKGHDTVVASWMTKQDRDDAVADNVAYLNAVLDQIVSPGDAIFFAGFSQGASMAYRAAQLCARPSMGVVAVAGDVPPELCEKLTRPWPPIFIGAGAQDSWFNQQKLDTDVERLRRTGAEVEVCRFAGVHEWNAEVSEAAGTWLRRVAEP